MEKDEKWVIQRRKKLKEWLQQSLIEGWVRKDDSSKFNLFGQLVQKSSQLCRIEIPTRFHVFFTSPLKKQGSQTSTSVVFSCGGSIPSLSS